jgi:NAD-dependent deacetylase
MTTPEPGPVAEADVARAAGRLLRADRVAVLTGAGVSAESGIPTFRGLGGLWRGRDPLRLATPEAFAADPGLVWEFYNWRRGVVAAAAPNPAHAALAALGRVKPGLVLITQNVDRLHQRAGSRGVVELHGNLAEVRCTACGATADRDGEALPPLPRCGGCGALARPAVVWFGEALPPGAWSRAESAVRAAGALLVVGTSVVVYPAAGLDTTARRGGAAVIEVNLEPTPVRGAVDIGLYGPAGVVLPRVLAAMAGG